MGVVGECGRCEEVECDCVRVDLRCVCSWCDSKKRRG